MGGDLTQVLRRPVELATQSGHNPGENLADFFRRSASYVDKILNGARPGDLPIEQPTKFNLVINRKTAEALGVTIPPKLYIFADEVID